jgi:hypothetical protein
MPTFSDPRALRKHLEEAAAHQLRLGVIETQAQLGSTEVSPYDTGRFRSSWFASKGAASSEVAAEGTNAPNTDAQGLQVGIGDEVHLTNSLPYAEAVAVEGRVVSKPRTWFKSFRDVRLPEILEQAGVETKRRFDL